MAGTSISVVIPTHNRPDGLAAAIQSVAGQTLWPLELIVVDDGSEPPVDHDFFQDIPGSIRTLLVRNETSGGAAKARNLGVERAKGSWVAFLDDDDAFLPDKIETITRAIEGSPGVDLIYHPAEINMVRESTRYRSGARDLNKSGDVLRQLLIRNLVGGASMTILKKKLFLDLGGFDESLPAMEDWDLWIRVAGHGGRFFFLNKVLTRYFHDSQAGSLTKDTDKTERSYRRLHEKFAGDYENLSPEDRHLFWKGKLQFEVFQALLRKEHKAAAKKQFRLAMFSKHPVEFLKFLGVSLWPGGVFSLRSRTQQFLQ